MGNADTARSSDAVVLTSAEAPVGDEGAADAADIEALLATLAHFRLSAAADLSAVAGALDAQRPDIAADVVDGTRRDLEQLQERAANRQLTPAPPSVKAIAGHPAEGAIPAPSTGDVRPSGRRWQAKVLAGALAAGLSSLVIPQLTSVGGHPARTGAAGATQQPANIRLVSSEFASLSRTLQSSSATPAQVLTAARSWQRAIATSLPQAATDVSAATHIVRLLRQERTMVQATPAMRTPAKHSAALALETAGNSLLAQLRAMASDSVLAVLPKVISALTQAPVAPAPKSSPHPAYGRSTTPGAIPSPSAGRGTSPAPLQTPQPTAPTGSNPIPQLPLPSLPVPPPPILNRLGGLLSPTTSRGNTSNTSSSTQQSALSESVANALNGLGLGN